MAEVNSHWLGPDEAGYFAIGYDEFVGGKNPAWTANSTSLEPLLSEAGRWAHDAVEFDGYRRVEIFYMTDEGRYEGPDMIITVGSPTN